VLTEFGELDLAREHLDLARQAAPLNLAILTNSGHWSLDAGRYAEAIDHYQQVLHQSPQIRQCRIGLAAALVGIGRYEEAVEHCVSMLKEEPACAEAHVNLASALHALHRDAEAITHARTAVKFDPDSANAQAALAMLLSQISLADARYHMAIARRLKPTSPTINLGMGNLLAPKDPRAAIPYFEAAVAAKPDFAEAHFNLANAWVALGNPASAVPHLEAVTRLKPDWEAARKNLQILKGQLEPPPAPSVTEGAANRRRLTGIWTAPILNAEFFV
jgi:tetratricopeptide (TPR) repeat protein